MSSPSRQADHPPASSSGPQPVRTAAELARLLGVSRATVSIVLRGDAARHKIPQATADRIREAARRHHYVPNLAARSLRSQKSCTVTLLCSNFALDWTEQLLQVIEPGLEAAGYSLVVAAHRDDYARQVREVEAAVQRRDVALIVMPLPRADELYAGVRRAGIPLIFLGDYPASMPHESRIVWDASDAVRTALEHLIAIGRRRIAYVGTRHTLALHVARRTAYAQTLRDAGLAVDPVLVVERPDGEREVGAVVAPAMDALLALQPDKRPDAIFCMNDGLAFEVMRQLDLRGVAVPESIAVAGLGDLPMAADSGIGLTTVAEPVRELGQACVDALNQIVRSQRDVVQQTIGTRPDALRVRRSTVTHSGSAH